MKKFRNYLVQASILAPLDMESGEKGKKKSHFFLWRSELNAMEGMIPTGFWRKLR